LCLVELAMLQEYENDKADPPVPRGMPPVSGRIAWSRQLYRKISMPMAFFRVRHSALQH